MEQQITWDEVQKDLDTTVLAEDVIKDNKFPFIFNKEFYQVKMPDQREIALAREIYNAKKLELLQKPNTMLEKKLRKVLKETQEIDISELEKQVEKIEYEIVQVELSGAKLKDTEVTALQNLKNKRDKLFLDRRVIMDEIGNHLASSIENQAKDEQYNYLTSTCTEKCIDEKTNKYEKVWKSFEDYKKDQSKLTYVALGALTRLLLN